MKTYIKRPIRIIFGWVSAVLILAQCSSGTSNEEIEKYQQRSDSLSVETATDVTIRYTDSARLKAIVTAPLMERYPDADKPYLEMTKGLRAEFYDRDGQVTNWLRANYGKHHEEEKTIELRNKVQVRNKYDEQLESEELFWDQTSKTIHTDKFVKIKRKDELIYGEGFESNETFTKYKIIKPSGRVKLKETEKDTEDIEDPDTIEEQEQ